MSFFLIYYLKILILPPTLNLLIAIFGFIIWRSYPKVAKFFIVFSLVSLWMLSTPIIAKLLLDPLQYQYTPLDLRKNNTNEPAAIVVLEAGLNLDVPEYGKPTVSANTLTRLHYAAYLHKKMRLPILVSGNDPTNPSIDQAQIMRNALQDYFNVPTKWQENRGYNTSEEAFYATEILKKEGIKKIYLVTHALHMPRSMLVFQATGLHIVPAPTGFLTFDDLSLLLPTANALSISTQALNEYIGFLWYQLKLRTLMNS